VKFYDTTLRDGEQTIGVCFSADEKVTIAQMLDEAGVERIEVGMPIVSREDRNAASRIVNRGLKAEPWGFARCKREDIDACLDAGLKSIICEIATSPYKMKAYGLDQNKVLDKMLDCVQYAKSQKLYTAFFAVDATRADLAFLETVYKAAVQQGGADEAVVVDTLGVATPEAMRYLARLVKSWVGVPLMAHCHNDFGMATACTMSCVLGGADYVQVTVNGLGEKTGNTDLAEAVLAARLYGLECDVDLTKMRALSQEVEKISAVPMSPLKAVVGQNVFKRESGVTIAQVVNYPPAVEGYAPEVIGAEREIFLSKKSGKASIEWKLRNLNLSIDDEKIQRILTLVKERGVANKGLVSDDEFEAIIRRVL
jgi:isopropylmalate/homocitrate/citramalate synthase